VLTEGSGERDLPVKNSEDSVCVCRVSDDAHASG
jgi:hypothetical protein